MKKIVSILLAVVMIFSLTATMALAADDVKVIFTDERGNVIKEITVDYGEDFNAKAPQDTYVDDGYRYFISGWETNHPAFKGTILTTLPAIKSGDGVKEITFRACYDVEEITTENVVGGVVDTIFGEDTTDMLSSFIAAIKAFFQGIILYLMNFSF